MEPNMVNGRKRPSRFDYPVDPRAGPSHRPVPAQDSDIEEVAFIKNAPPAYKCAVDFTSNANPNLSDLILVADGRKFYVDKRNLARHSTTLNAMFFGRFEESRQDEIKVDEVGEESLQRFLELTVGAQKVLTEENIEGVLVLADYWDAPIVKKTCEVFIMESQTMQIPKKLELATRFHLDEELKERLVSSITSFSTLEEVQNGSIIIYTDKTMLGLLFNKCMELHRKSESSYSCTFTRFSRVSRFDL